MLATAVSGGAAAVAGVVMVAIGAVRMKKSSGKAPPKHAITPSFGPGLVGLSWSARF